MLVKSSRISDYRLKKIMKHFCIDVCADKTGRALIPSATNAVG